MNLANRLVLIFKLPDHLIGRIADSESAHLGSTPSWAATLFHVEQGLR